MGTTNELIQRLHEEKLNLVEQFRGLVAEVEAAGGTWSGEDELKSQAVNTEIDTRTKRIGYLIELQKTNAELDDQRAQFEKIVRPEGVQGDSPNSDDARLRAFIAAAAPNSETWAPRQIEFKITPEVKRMVHARFAGEYEYRDLTKLTAGAGGDLVPTGFVPTLYQHLVEAAAVRQTGPSIFTTSNGENLPIPKTTTHGAAALVAEGAAIAESDAAFAQVILNAYKYGQLIQLSTELVTDSAVDIVGYVAESAGRNVGLAQGTHFVTGTGTAQPQGVANAPTAGKTGATGQTLTVLGEDLIDLYHSIVSGYRTRGVWLMNDLSAAIVRKLREGTGATAGNFLWQPGLQASMPDLLLGRPVVTDPNMAVMAANAYSIAFGDFGQYYAIRDVNSVRFERSDDFAFANDLVTFRVLIRSDGKQVVNGATGAVKFYRNSAT